jgi:hypothetical protein
VDVVQERVAVLGHQLLADGHRDDVRGVHAANLVEDHLFIGGLGLALRLLEVDDGVGQFAALADDDRFIKDRRLVHLAAVGVRGEAGHRLALGGLAVERHLAGDLGESGGRQAGGKGQRGQPESLHGFSSCGRKGL